MLEKLKHQKISLNAATTNAVICLVWVLMSVDVASAASLTDQDPGMLVRVIDEVSQDPATSLAAELRPADAGDCQRLVCEPDGTTWKAVTNEDGLLEIPKSVIRNDMVLRLGDGTFQAQLLATHRREPPETHVVVYRTTPAAPQIEGFTVELTYLYHNSFEALLTRRQVSIWSTDRIGCEISECTDAFLWHGYVGDDGIATVPKIMRKRLLRIEVDGYKNTAVEMTALTRLPLRVTLESQP